MDARRHAAKPDDFITVRRRLQRKDLVLFLAGLRVTHSRCENISTVSRATTSSKSDVTAFFSGGSFEFDSRAALRRWRIKSQNVSLGNIRQRIKRQAPTGLNSITGRGENFLQGR